MFEIPQIKVISITDVKLELEEIETQQQGLEKQGVRLEQLIRDKSESESSTLKIRIFYFCIIYRVNAGSCNIRSSFRCIAWYGC